MINKDFSTLAVTLFLLSKPAKLQENIKYTVAFLLFTTGKD